jgi:glycerol-3-phosphate dehydrogenase
MTANLAQYCRDPLDVLIVGGGIVGAGIARDATMRGLRTLLVERRDFAYGTSSRSSRLLHGGLRYLAQGRLGLVHEASVEKMTLHRIAPHLAQPLPFLFPTWKGTPWPRWRLSIGVRLYDLLCGGRNLGKSSTLGSAEILALLPGLRQQHLTGGVRYFDGLTSDARLVIDTLRSAERHGARLANYTALENAEPHGGAWRCLLREECSGARLEVRARAVVNAAGPWGASFPYSGVRLRLTKGVHLVLSRERFPVPEAVVLPEGKRILFVIPWGERVILGTTDTDYSGDPDAVRADASDVAYILAVVNAAFPRARLVAGDILALWSGLRPLIAPRRPQAGAPSDLSRRHWIHMTAPGWFDVAGGKLTTYRLMAQQTVDSLARHLGAKLPPCRTAETPLVEGGPAFSGILPPPVSREAVAHYCRREWARRLDDVMLRRSSWHYYHADAFRIAEHVALWMAEELGWTPSQRSAELARYLQTAEFPAQLEKPA